MLLIGLIVVVFCLGFCFDIWLFCLFEFLFTGFVVALMLAWLIWLFRCFVFCVACLFTLVASLCGFVDSNLG